MTEIIIAGGGLAGGAAGAALARAGKNVTIIEREMEPADKICGEFLSAEAQAYLAAIGLDVWKLGGTGISHVRLVRGKHCVTSALPFRGLGLSRKVLDEALLSHAAACGAEIRRGHHIKNISQDNGTVLSVDGIGAMKAETLFLATGKHELRGAHRDCKNIPDLIGFKMYFRLAASQEAALSNHVELMMFPHGYAGLQLVENNHANLCLLVQRGALRRAGGKWPDLLEHLQGVIPQLAARLAGAEALLAVPLTIARVPYGYIYRPKVEDMPGVYRLGDQAGVIQSFTGDGMSIALHSAAMAAECYLSGEKSADFHRRLAGDIHGQISRAGALYTLTELPFGQAAVVAAARFWPGLMAATARLTRVPERKMRSAA